MAYVIWRVVMKKYSSFRISLNGTRVTPSRASPDTNSWQAENGPEHEVTKVERKSKAKSVKKYLKKCKTVLSGASQPSQSELLAVVEETAVHSGAIDKEEIKVDEERKEVDGGGPAVAGEEKEVEEDSSLVLQHLQDVDNDGHVVIRDNLNGKNEVAKLVDKYFGNLYENYQNSKRCLIRQARDLLVCEYHGCLSRFEQDFCVPAAELLKFVKCGNLGWPLSLGAHSIAIHLSPLAPSLLQPHDFYLTLLRTDAALQLALAYRHRSRPAALPLAELGAGRAPAPCSPLRSLADLELAAYGDGGGEQLPALLRTMLLSVEHAVERAPLDEAAEAGREGACGSFGLAGSIPHIDSDEDEEKEAGSGTSTSRKLEITQPKRITDLPEKLLMSGINLPGTSDYDEKPIILCYAECIARAGLNKYEIAKLLLYYASIPTNETSNNLEFTILLLAENVSDSNVIQVLDKSFQLIASHVKIHRFLVWKPISDKNSSLQIPSHIQAQLVTDESTLFTFIKQKEAPVSCGGNSNHDQLEWVEFFKQAEPFTSACQLAGKRLLNVLSQLRDNEALTRQFLSQQCREITHALDLDEVQSLRRDGQQVLNSLKERSQWLGASRDVKRTVSFSIAACDSVERVRLRLEQLRNERMARIKELGKLNTLKEEAQSLLSWIAEKEGEENLNSLIEQLRTVSDSCALKVVTNLFENYFFIAWTHIERANDLYEESKTLKDAKTINLTTVALQLHAQMRTFREHLETTREQLEDCTQCFHFLEQPSPVPAHLESHLKLATRSQNTHLVRLIRQQIAILQSFEPDGACTSTPIKSCTTTSSRRKPSSSDAYIYRCNHHANGEFCTCYESDSESSATYKLKKKYMQSLEVSEMAAGSAGGRKSSLGGIKEEGESGGNVCEDDSGMSTADNSIGEGSLSSGGSKQGSVMGEKTSEEEGEFEERGKVGPIEANGHLYCHGSSLDLPSDALYAHMDCKTQKTLTFIIREMIETERDYVKSLDYIIINYIPELNREDIPQALRGQRNIIFGNVEKIYEFHSQHFLHDLESCESNPLQIGQIFTKHNNKFYLYALYNKNKPKSDSLMSEYGSAFFKSKQNELKDHMDLASYLLKPVQRMGKYALLLQQMMKICAGTKRSQEFVELQQAEEMVRYKLRHGNDLLAEDSIRECDVNLKEQGRLLRQNEFLVFEGRKKSLRQVFLFEDLILFSKAKRFPDRKNLDLYYYKHSIKMTDIGLTAKMGESPTKFAIWFRKRKPNDTFTLQSMSEEVKKAWVEEVSQLLWKQAIKNREVRMAEMSSMGIGNKPCLDIRPSADQISDRSISDDQLSRTAPRFRSTIGTPTETCRTLNRPHSVISMSSSVSSGSSSSGGSTNGSVQLNLNFYDGSKTYHRSATLNSQCSTESGIIADMSVGSDEYSEQANTTL